MHFSLGLGPWACLRFLDIPDLTPGFPAAKFSCFFLLGTQHTPFLFLQAAFPTSLPDSTEVWSPPLPALTELISPGILCPPWSQLGRSTPQKRVLPASPTGLQGPSALCPVLCQTIWRGHLYLFLLLLPLYTHLKAAVWGYLLFSNFLTPFCPHSCPLPVSTPHFLQSRKRP